MLKDGRLGQFADLRGEDLARKWEVVFLRRSWYTNVHYVCAVANNLFSRKQYGEWKRNERGDNTLPAISDVNWFEAYIEALILGGITNEIILPEMETAVTYCNDGSAQSGVDN